MRVNVVILNESPIFYVFQFFGSGSGQIQVYGFSLFKPGAVWWLFLLQLNRFKALNKAFYSEQNYCI